MSPRERLLLSIAFTIAAAWIAGSVARMGGASTVNTIAIAAVAAVAVGIEMRRAMR